MQKTEKKRKVIKTGIYAAQGRMLAGSFFLTGVFLLAGRIAVANILGDAENGILMVPQHICEFILALSFYLLPTALSGALSLKNAAGQKRNAFRLLLFTTVVQASLGLIFALVCFFGAKTLSEWTTSGDVAVRVFRMLAPVFFLSAFPSVLRGYFQAAGRPGVPVVSQVAESAVWSIGSAVAAWGMMKYSVTGDQQADNALVFSSNGAAGAVAGGVIAALGGCIFLGITLFLQQRRSRVVRNDHIAGREKLWQTFRFFVVSVCPAFALGLIGTLGRLVKPAWFSHIMDNRGIDQADFLAQMGIYFGRYEPFLIIPVVMAASAAILVMPVMRVMSAAGAKKAVNERAGKGIRMAAVLLFPSGTMLAVLAPPLLSFLFNDTRESTVLLVRMGGISVIFGGFAFASCILLYGMNRTRDVLKHAIISFITDLAVFAVLALSMKLEVYSIWGSSLASQVVLCILNYYKMYHLGGLHPSDIHFVLKPFLVSVVMGTASYAVYLAVDLTVGGRFLPALLPVFVAVVIYGITVWKLDLIKERKSE